MTGVSYEKLFDFEKVEIESGKSDHGEWNEQYVVLKSIDFWNVTANVELVSIDNKKLYTTVGLDDLSFHINSEQDELYQDLTKDYTELHEEFVELKQEYDETKKENEFAEYYLADAYDKFEKKDKEIARLKDELAKYESPNIISSEPGECSSGQAESSLDDYIAQYHDVTPRVNELERKINILAKINGLA